MPLPESVPDVPSVLSTAPLVLLLPEIAETTTEPLTTVAETSATEVGGSPIADDPATAPSIEEPPPSSSKEPSLPAPTPMVASGDKDTPTTAETVAELPDLIVPSKDATVEGTISSAEDVPTKDEAPESAPATTGEVAIVPKLDTDQALKSTPTADDIPQHLKLPSIDEDLLADKKWEEEQKAKAEKEKKEIAEEEIRERVYIPRAFIDKCLWSYTPKGENDEKPPPPSGKSSDLPSKPSSSRSTTPLPPPPPSVILPPGILSDTLATTARSFSYRAQVASLTPKSPTPFDKSDPFDDPPKKVSREPSITLYCPEDASNHVIDAVVRNLAEAQKADIVVLDSLDLGAGEAGPLGKEFEQTLDRIYGPSGSTPAQEAHIVRQIRRYMRALIDVELDSPEKPLKEVAVEESKAAEVGKPAGDASIPVDDAKIGEDVKSEESKAVEGSKLEQPPTIAATEAVPKINGVVDLSEPTSADLTPIVNIEDPVTPLTSKEADVTTPSQPSVTTDVLSPKPDLPETAPSSDVVETSTTNSAKDTTAGEATEASTPPIPKPKPRRRIIYLRDFGSISPAIKPFLQDLIAAIQSRRCALDTPTEPIPTPESTPTGHRTTTTTEPHKPDPTLLQSTVLIMGVSASPSSLPVQCCASCQAGKFPSAFEKGGQALRDLLPRVGTVLPDTTKLPTGVDNVLLRQLATPPPVNPSSGGLPSFGAPPPPLPPVSDGEDTMYGTTVSIFPKDGHDAASRKARRTEKEERCVALNDMLLRLAIGAMDGVVNGNILDALILQTSALKEDEDSESDSDDEVAATKKRKKGDAKVGSVAKEDGDESDESDSDSESDTSDESDNESVTTEGGFHTFDAGKIFTSSKDYRRHIMPVAHVEQVAALAVGLATAQSSGPTIDVSTEAIAQAYKMLSLTVAERKAWIKTDGLSDREKSKASRNGKAKKEKEDPIITKVRRMPGLSDHEQRLLGGIIDTRALSTTFDDVCVDHSIVDSLRTIVSLPLLYPKAFSSGILKAEAMSGILLYGPPGTGKTMLCRALAKECDVRMLQVAPSDVKDMYVGETEKLVRAIFTLARRLAPCVIFIDELDALFGARSAGKRDGAAGQTLRAMLTEFMQEMDGLRSAGTNKEKGIIVIGATNRPFDLDDAVLRRLPIRKMIDLPGPMERERIIKVHLRGETLKDVDIGDIARRTEFYSGSDLKHLAVAAALAALKDTLPVRWELKGKKGEDKKAEPTLAAPPPPKSEFDENGVHEIRIDVEDDEDASLTSATPTNDAGPSEKSPKKTKKEKKKKEKEAPLAPRVVTAENFKVAFSQVSASCSKDMTSLKELRKWNSMYSKNQSSGLGTATTFPLGNGSVM